MGFNFKSSKNNEINEVSDTKFHSEQPSEINKNERNVENFDDCSLNEIPDTKEKEKDTFYLEKKENYNDCNIKIDEIKEKNPELIEYEDFSDCGKEIDNQSTHKTTEKCNDVNSKEIISHTDSELSQKGKFNENESIEKYSRYKGKEETINTKEIQVTNGGEANSPIVENTKILSESYDETFEKNNGEDTDCETSGDDSNAENIEKVKFNDYDSEIDISKIDENNLSRNISRKTMDATNIELSDSIDKQMNKDVVGKTEFYPKNDMREITETMHANEEKNITEVMNEYSDITDAEVKQEIDEITENKDLTENIENYVFDDVSEIDNSKHFGSIDEDVHENHFDMIESSEENEVQQENIKSTLGESYELENNQTDIKTEFPKQSLQDRVHSVLNEEDISYSEICNLHNEQLAELQTKIKDKKLIESELKLKFDEVLSKEKGRDEYKQLLKEYNSLQDKKNLLDNQIVGMEEQHNILVERKKGLRDVQMQRGLEAMSSSQINIDSANSLLEKFERNYSDEGMNRTELTNIKDDSRYIINELSAEQNSIKLAMNAKIDEMSEYINSNEMDRHDTFYDWRYKQLTEEYNAMQEMYDKIDYSIAKLEENNKGITERLSDDSLKSSKKFGNVIKNLVSFSDKKNIDNTGWNKTKEIPKDIKLKHENTEDYYTNNLDNSFFDEQKNMTNIDKANLMQKLYDQTYYDANINRTKLISIRDNSYSVINELSAEQNSIKLAMRAKKDQISEYINSSNALNEYGATHDLYYKQMTEEYNSMKETYDKIGSSIVKLDENNKRINERLADDKIKATDKIDNIRKRIVSFLNRKDVDLYQNGIKEISKDVKKSQKTIENYCTNDLEGFISDEKKSMMLSEKVEFQNDEDFAKGLGDEKKAIMANGYNDGKKSYVKESGPHPLKTATHEHVHQLSCNDVKDKSGFVTEYRRGVSINGNLTQLNEAMTEFFTKKIMGNEYPINPNVRYKDNMLLIEEMESGFGMDTLKEAYFQNKPDLLKNRYEFIMGEGSWELFTKALDDTLCGDSEQERKAFQFARGMAESFARKTKGRQ